MNYEKAISDLEKRVAQLEQTVLNLSRNIPGIVGNVDDTSNRVDAITPYTAVKTAYYGDTEVTFYDVPQGKVSVYIDDCLMDYSVNRIEDRLIVSFEPLEVASKQITVSVQ